MRMTFFSYVEGRDLQGARQDGKKTFKPRQTSQLNVQNREKE